MRVFSWLFRRKGYSEILEEYQQQINRFQNNVTQLKRRQKVLFPMIHKTMLLLCLVLSVFAYFWFHHWIFALLSVISHVALTYFMRRAVIMYISRRISSIEKKIQICKSKQQHKLDELKELTKFSQTESLIQKYEKTTPQVVSPESRPPVVGNATSSINTASNSRLAAANAQLRPIRRSIAIRESSQAGDGGGASNNNNNHNNAANNPAAESGVVIGDSVKIPSKSSGWLDRLVDLAVGQNPNNCAALVCQKCFTHNGLIMLEDWADHPIRFKCRTCNFLNKPKQVEETTATSSNVATSESSSSSSAASTSSATTIPAVSTAATANSADTHPTQRRPTTSSSEESSALPNPAPSNASS